MRFGTWNARSLYRSGSLTAAAVRELARYKFDLVGVQEVRWDKGGEGVRTEDYIFFSGQGSENHLQLETGFFVHHRIVSAVKRIEFVSHGLSYIVLRGRWCNIVVLKEHAPSEEESDDSEDSFDVDSFNLRKVSEIEVRKQYRTKISNRFAALEN